ncbi:hypothetical protein J0H58_08530 [bacterium]|nr:hypothetical protein [bacterium]
MFLPDGVWKSWFQDWTESLFIGRPPTHDRITTAEVSASVEDVCAGVEAVRYVRDVLGDVRTGVFDAYVFPERIGPPELLPTLAEVAHRTPGFFLRSEPAFRATRMHYADFLERIRFLLDGPAAADWAWLGRVAVEVRENPWAGRPGREIMWVRRVFPAVIPPLSVRLGVKCDPRVVAPDVGDEELILLAHNWSVDAREAARRLLDQGAPTPAGSPGRVGAAPAPPTPWGQIALVEPGGRVPPPEPDGPFGVSGFRFGGVPVDFKRAALQYRLVQVLWGAAAGSPRPAQEAGDVMDAVWGEEHDREDYNLRQLCADARDKFEKENCPVTVAYRNGKVQLIPLGP